MPTLGAKLTPLKASLTSALLHSLSSLNNRKTVVVGLILFLLRLGAGAAARSTFLSARSEVTKKRVRMIRFEGAVELYINDLAIVIFTGIKHTADWFLASFKENEAASCKLYCLRRRLYFYLVLHRFHRLGKDTGRGLCFDVQKAGLHVGRRFKDGRRCVIDYIQPKQEGIAVLPS